MATAEAVGLVLDLFTLPQDSNLEGCGLPIAGSHVAIPWGMKIKPKRGREGEDKREKWDSDDIFEPLNCAILEIIHAPTSGKDGSIGKHGFASSNNIKITTKM